MARNGQALALRAMKRNERVVDEGFWRKVRRLFGRLPFTQDLLAAYFCAIDQATPIRARAILFGALAYFVLPADAIPDFIAVLGFTDDAAVLAAAITTAGAYVTETHRQAARQALMAEASEPRARQV